MLKAITSIFFLLFLNGCAQIFVFLGPAVTGASTGSMYQAGLSYGSSTAITKITGKYYSPFKVKKLLDILESDVSANDPSRLVENFKPPIFWKEKNIVIEQLKRWDKPELKKLIELIYDTEIECKKNYDVSNIILQQFNFFEISDFFICTKFDARHVDVKRSLNPPSFRIRHSSPILKRA
jgi:hypothetical protein